MKKTGHADQKKTSSTEEASGRWRALSQAVAGVCGSLKLEDDLTAALDGLFSLFPDTAGAEIHLLDEKQETLFIKGHRGLPPWLIETGTFQKGEGLPGRVLETGRLLTVENLSKDDRVPQKKIQKEGLVSYVGVPVRSSKQTMGVLGLYTRESRNYAPEDKELLSHFAQALGAAVQNAADYERADQRTRRFTTISRAITVTRQLGTLEEVLQDITKVLVQSLGFDQSWIGLVDEGSDVLQGNVGFGTGMKRGIDARYTVEKESLNPAVKALVEQKPNVFQFIEDVPKGAYRSWMEAMKVQSCCHVPILSEEKSVGVIGVFYTTDRAFEEEDVKTLNSVAEQASIAIENARLYEEVSRSEERYRTLFESSGTCFVIVDRDQRFQLVNRAFENLCGYGRDALMEEMHFHQFIKAKDGKDTLSEKLYNPPQSWEAEFIDKDGMIWQVHIATTLVPGSENILVAVIDMTKERELERRLFRTEELAAIGELSAGIAHEIRNPLVAITTSVSLLKDEPELSSEGRELLEVVKEESDHLAAIVEDFLRFARPKKPVLQQEDMGKILKDVVRRCKDRDTKKIGWIEKYDDDIPSVSVDRHQMQQVMTNLVLNGIDAMSDNGVIEIGMTRERGVHGEHVKVIVKDSGEGIDPKELSKIFQPFYSTKEKGTGMGLAICHRIVNDHDGEILVESEVGKGTTFSVLLPVSQNR